MEQYKQEFIEFMVESDVLKFGEFTSKERKKIPVFYECRSLCDRQHSFSRLGEYYAKAIHEHYGDDFRCAVRTGIQGDSSLSVATAMAYSELYGKDIRYCSNRKEVKDHGDTGILLGSKIQDGDKVVIIEDVTTSGKSIEETFPIIRAQGKVEIVGLIVSLNRMERGKGDKSALEEIKETYGFDANAIVSMADVVEHLHNRPCQGKIVIDDTLKTAIDQYYQEYGVK